MTSGEDDAARRLAERRDHNLTLDAQDDDWAWRRRIRANPVTARVYRITVAVLGLVIVVGGLIVVPAPGPGWLIVFAGVSVWATEFEWAQRLLHRRARAVDPVDAASALVAEGARHPRRRRSGPRRHLDAVRDHRGMELAARRGRELAPPRSGGRLTVRLTGRLFWRLRRPASAGRPDV